MIGDIIVQNKTGLALYILAGVAASITVIAGTFFGAQRYGRKVPKAWIAIGSAVMFLGHGLTAVYRSVLPSLIGVLICVVAAFALFSSWKGVK
ncbi:MAG TPA: hypothetical protein VFC07_07375 [Verrucomicrobiae bacterium]|nr:hypothetical protein [Verrucomicrobiae bacterium]